MQDSHRQLRYQQLLSNYWSIVVIIILTPLLLCAVLPILPTHDDWTSLTSPDFTPFFTKEHFFFYGYHWRPFDNWIGWIAGRNPQLIFPSFHHTLVVLGHFLCSLAVFRFLGIIGFNRTAKNVTTLFFFITPVTMATVLAVDSQNQVYALVTDLIAFYVYVRKGKFRYVAWPLLIFLATLFKENGLMWGLICPILAYGFDFIDHKKLRKDLLLGIGIIIFYALLIAVQPKDIIIHSEYEPDQLKILKNFIKFIFSSFFTVDYIYLLHQPNRNLLLAAVSFLFAAPFMYYVFLHDIKRLAEKKMVCTLLSLLIAVGPHLLTIFSMMHTYAGLAMVAVIVANAVDRQYAKQKGKILAAFLLFLMSSLTIDYHLYQESIKSGFIGKKMAVEAIRKTKNPVDKVYLIIIDKQYPKLSSFCVIPYDAFGWGIAAKYETNYKWPQIITDTIIYQTNYDINHAYTLGKKILHEQQYDAVWIVDHDNVDVIK